MRRQAAIIGTFALALGVLACGETEEEAAFTAVDVTCPSGQNKLAVNVWSGDEVVYSASTTDVSLYGNALGEAIGVLGKLPESKGVVVRRDGDLRDGVFDHVGTYDPSAYPFVGIVQGLAVSESGDFSESMPVYFGYAGNWDITSVPAGGTGWLEGKLNATSVVDFAQENCWEDSSCKPTEGGRIEACFSVEAGAQ